MNNIIVSLILILDFIFNNPIGITALIAALFLGILICKHINRKRIIICGCTSLVFAVLSVLILIVGNSPDYLIFPLFAIPFFIVISIVFLVFGLIKLIKKKKS